MQEGMCKQDAKWLLHENEIIDLRNKFLAYAKG